MSKFSQLSSFGFNSSIKFECRDGRVHVDFKADLGYAPQYFQQNVHDIHQFNQSYTSAEPKRRPRKHRKYSNKKVLSTATADTSVEGSNQNSDESTESIHDKDFESETLELEPPVENLESLVDANSVSAFEIATDLPCNDSTTMNSNQCVKYGIDDYADPIATFFSSPTFGPLAPPPTSIKTDDQQCRFCDADFSCWEDFAKQVNKSSFICNNCLDYYPYKSWFLISELSRVDVGSGDYFYLNQP